VHATGTVNGLPLRLRWDGGWKTYECGVLLYDRELPADLPSELLGEATSSGLGFDVMPSVMPSMGVVSFEGGSGFSAFGGIVTRCSGAQTCLAERSICGDTVGCEYGVAYGGGFDRLELPASVALP
jgi:hypothetical protein